MNVSAGGQVYELARLRFADIRDLRAAGVLKVLRDPAAADEVAFIDAMAEVVCTSIRRGGGQITAREFLERLDCQEGAKIREAYEAVMMASGFLSEGEGTSPNAESPAT